MLKSRIDGYPPEMHCRSLHNHVHIPLFRLKFLISLKHLEMTDGPSSADIAIPEHCSAWDMQASLRC